MKEKVLQALAQAGDYVSGQALCEQFQVSRTAVWLAVNALKEEGYEIEAVRNRGYRLVQSETSDIFNETELVSRMHTRFVGKPLVFEKTTGSTNADIQALADQGSPEGTLAVAAAQTAGKGRRGRVWESPPDKNVYMSLLLRPGVPTGSAPVITLVMALAVYKASLLLPGTENVRFGIKWPNDIVGSTDGKTYKKLVGILTEMRLEDQEIRDVTVGIGLNCNQTEFPEELEASASSYQLLTGQKVCRAQFVADIWEKFEEAYGAFLQTGDLRLLKEDYEAALVNLGRQLRILDPAGEYRAEALGVTETGELIVRPENETETRVIGTGEISVRGVMGYV